MSAHRTATAALLCAGLTAPAAHAAIDWNFAASTGAPSGSSFGNQRTYSSEGVSVAVSAWANTGGADASVPASNQTLESAYLGWYGGSGFSATNRDNGRWPWNDQNEGSAPEHAIDNNQRYDSILLSFSDAVKLETLKLGWVGGDSDLTVMAYTGNAGAAPLAGLQYQGLLSSGWELIGHYADVGLATGAVNAGGVVSSFWLIGAFNPLAGSNPGWSLGNDYVKLAAVGATRRVPPESHSSVPEPGSLALAALGLVGLLRLRRRG